MSAHHLIARREPTSVPMLFPSRLNPDAACSLARFRPPERVFGLSRVVASILCMFLDSFCLRAAPSRQFPISVRYSVRSFRYFGCVPVARADLGPVVASLRRTLPPIHHSVFLSVARHSSPLF